MKVLVIMAFCLLTAATCTEKSANSVQNVNVKKSKHQVFIDKKGNHYNAFIDIPAHLRTPEQKQFTESLTDIFINGVVAENNHMVLKFSKDECLARGMTEENYNELIKNLADNNQYFDSIGNKEVPRMIDDLHRDMKVYKSKGYQSAK